MVAAIDDGGDVVALYEPEDENKTVTYRYRDGVWSAGSSLIASFLEEPKEIAITDSLVVVLMSNGQLYRSSNFGDSWSTGLFISNALGELVVYDDAAYLLPSGVGPVNGKLYRADLDYQADPSRPEVEEFTLLRTETPAATVLGIGRSSTGKVFIATRHSDGGIYVWTAASPLAPIISLPGIAPPASDVRVNAMGIGSDDQLHLYGSHGNPKRAAEVGVDLATFENWSEWRELPGQPLVSGTGTFVVEPARPSEGSLYPVDALLYSSRSTSTSTNSYGHVQIQQVSPPVTRSSERLALSGTAVAAVDHSSGVSYPLMAALSSDERKVAAVARTAGVDRIVTSSDPQGNIWNRVPQAWTPLDLAAIAINRSGVVNAFGHTSPALNEATPVRHYEPRTGRWFGDIQFSGGSDSHGINRALTFGYDERVLVGRQESSTLTSRVYEPWWFVDGQGGGGCYCRNGTATVAVEDGAEGAAVYRVGNATASSLSVIPMLGADVLAGTSTAITGDATATGSGELWADNGSLWLVARAAAPSGGYVVKETTDQGATWSSSVVGSPQFTGAPVRTVLGWEGSTRLWAYGLVQIGSAKHIQRSSFQLKTTGTWSVAEDLGEVAEGDDVELAIPASLSGAGRHGGSPGLLVKATTDGVGHLYQFGQIVELASYFDVSSVDPNEIDRPNESYRHQCECVGVAVDPVDTASGNFYNSPPALSVPGRGPGLAMNLMYSSSDAALDGPTGFGWSSTLSVRLVRMGDGTISVMQDTGAPARFAPDGQGGWAAPPRLSATLEENTDGSFTFTRRHLEQFRFSAEGRLQSISDLPGNEIIFEYSSSHPERVSAITDESGRTLAVIWNAAGRVATITGPSVDGSGPLTVEFGYDAQGDLVNYRDPSGGQWVMTYVDHRMETRRAPRHATKVMRNAYDSTGRVSWQEDELGRRTIFTYGALPGTTIIEFPDESKRADVFEGHARVKVIDGYGTPDARETISEFDPATFALEKQTRGTEVTVHEYDGEGNRRKTVDASGRVVEWTHNGLDEIVTESLGKTQAPLPVSSAAAVTTRWLYDSVGRVTKKIAAEATSEAAVTEYYYGGGSAHPSDLTSVLDPRLKTWRFQYDSHGYETSVESPEGDVTTRTYNSVGLLLTETSPKGTATAAAGDYTTGYSYDLANRITTVIDPTGVKSSHKLDANGNMLEIRTGITAAKPGGDLTLYGYDDADQQTALDEPGPGAKSYTYYPSGRSHQFINENGDVWTYAYYASGRLKSETAPGALPRTYSYDAAGRLTGVAQAVPGATCAPEARVGCISYSADPAGRPTGIDYSDSLTPDVTTITYDALGRRIAATTGGVTEGWTWDVHSRLSGHSDVNGRFTGYEWDKAGNNTLIAYPDGVGSVRRDFDEAGRLKTVTDWYNRTVRFDYDADSNWVGTVFPNEVGTGVKNTDEFVYDAAGRMTAVTWRDQSGAVLGSETYDRPAAAKGMVKGTVPTGAAGTAPKTNVFDTRDRLLSTGEESFEYDSAGNLTEGPNGARQVYDPAQQLCWTSPTATTGDCTTTPPNDATLYRYDDRGNRNGEARPDGAARTLAYDQADRLASATNTPVASISAMDGVAIAGNFDGELGDDVFWYRPGTGKDYAMWGAARSQFGRASNEFNVNGSYIPRAGDFDGDGVDDIFWYAPGTSADHVWFWFGRHGGGYDSKQFTVDDTYTPLAGDFDGDGFDDIYWYGSGTAGDLLWYGNSDVDGTAEFETGATTANGVYQPVAGDFDGNGSDDIFWYGPGSVTDSAWFSTGTRNSWTVQTGAGLQVTTTSRTPVVGNFDGTQDVDLDGNPDPARDDIIFSSTGNSSTTVWWGAEVALFGAATSRTITSFGSSQPFTGDFDDDGRDDLFLYVAGSAADRVFWGADRTVFGTQTGFASASVLDATYRYDSAGVRASKSVGGTTTDFTWTATGGLPLLLAEHQPTATTWLIYGPGGQPIEEIRPNTIAGRWLHHDQLGSVRLSTYQVNGSPWARRSFGAYGEVASASGGTQPMLGYAGQQTDVETGYQYLRARYYDPNTGQFLSRDPMVTKTEEPAAYASNNPSAYTDPSGYEPCEGFVECVGEGAPKVGKAVWSFCNSSPSNAATCVSILAYMSCPVTSGAGCAVGAAASNLATAGSIAETMYECGHSGLSSVSTGECGAALATTGVSLGSSAIARRLRVTKEAWPNAKMISVWKSDRNWNVAAGLISAGASSWLGGRENDGSSGGGDPC